MARSNPSYYISPSAISLTPNANNSANDIAVYISSGTKVKAYSPTIPGMGYVDNAFREWTLTGRNRRLADSGPYSIYIRLEKEGTGAYLVFSQNEYILSDGLTVEDGLPEAQTLNGRTDYWWLKIGEVSAASGGVRTVVLDTGILGTEQYNNDWQKDESEDPIRMNIAVTLDNVTADTLVSPVPYGKVITLSAWLTKGWDVPAEADHWEITRNTGSAEEDAAWTGEGVVSDGRFSINLSFSDTRNDLGQLGSETFFTIRAYDELDNIIAERTVNIPHHDTQAWTVEMDMHSFAIMVDDFGNVEGGLWTEEGEYRTYRLHAAVTARRGNKYLTLAPNGAAPGAGQYQIYPQAGDCTLMVSNGTVYITGIDNVKDGVAGSGDDVMSDEWYERMRRMKEVVASFTVVCEGVFSTIKSIPVSIGHLDTSIVDVQLTPETSAVQFTPMSGSFFGLPAQSELVASVAGSAVQPKIVDAALDIDGVAVAWTYGTGLQRRYRTTSGWYIRFERITEDQDSSGYDDSSYDDSSYDDSSYDDSSHYDDSSFYDDSSGYDDSSYYDDSSDSSGDARAPRYRLVLVGIPNDYQGSALVLGLTVTVKLAGQNYEYRRTFTVGLSRNGSSTATLYLYKRSAEEIAQTGIQSPLYYKFSTQKLYTDYACTTPLVSVNGWSPKIPAGTDPIYVTAAIAFSSADQDTINSNEWVEPVLMSSDGQPGSPGEHGVNTATIFIYKRSASGIALDDKPSDMYYCFADGKFYVGPDQTASEATSQLGGWQREIPSGDTPCYVRQAVALGVNAFDNVASEDWSGATKLVEDGTDGVTYRCKWQLSNVEVSALAAESSGQLKNVDSQNATLRATLMKRVGNNAEEVVQGSGQVKITFGSQNRTKTVSGGDMTLDFAVGQGTDVHGSSVKRATANFTLTGGDTFVFNIDKVFDGRQPVITIGSNDRHWYVNGVDTGVVAEGKDGTGVALKGTVDVVFNADATGSQRSLEGLTGISVGDCYTVSGNRHLYFYDGTSNLQDAPAGWNDLGEFKGEDGESSYMHIAWADNISFDTDGITPVGQTGFTTVYGANGHNYDYDWIGFCTDNNEADPTTFESYKWNYTKGKDGNDYEYVYMRSNAETAPTVDESGTDGSGRTQTQDEYLPAVGNYSGGHYAGSRFTDDPMGVSETWPYEYQAVRKKANGVWQAFSAATLHRTYSEDGESPYAASLDMEFAVVHVTGSGIPTMSQSIYIVPSLRKGVQDLNPVITAVKRNGTDMSRNGGVSTWTAPGLTVSFNSSTRVITVTYGITAAISGGRDVFTFTIAHVMDGTVVFSENKVLTVNATGSDSYSLLPSQNQIMVQRSSAGFVPETFTLTCGYSKVDVDRRVRRVAEVTGLIDGMYNLYFRRHGRETAAWEGNYCLYCPYGDSDSSYDDSSYDDSSYDDSSYDASGDGYRMLLQNASVRDYDAVEFILCRNTEPFVPVGSVTGQICSVSVPVLTNGSVGATGPSYYYLGEWADVNDSEYIPNGTRIEATQYERPFISYTQDGETLYFLYVGGGTGEDALVTNSTRENPALDSEHWEPMQSQNKYIISKAIFAQFAKFGGAVFNGDWMISAYGRIDGVMFQGDNRVVGGIVGEGSPSFSIPAYTLFDKQNPKATVDSLLYESDLELEDAGPHEISLGTVSLEAGATYSVRVYGRQQNEHGDVWVAISNGSFSLDALKMFKEGDNVAASYSSQGFFRVSEDGDYSVSIYEKGTQLNPPDATLTYYGAIMEFVEIAKVSFAPIYAVDLFAGGTIQRNTMYSGFMRMDKTVINQLNVYDFAGVTRTLDLEKSGSFIEIRDNVTVDLNLPLYSRAFHNVDADYARSLVGTKILIYLVNGHIYGSEVPLEWKNRVLNIDGERMTDSTGGDRYEINMDSIDVHDTFMCRASKEENDYNDSWTVYERYSLESGQFVELECLTDVDIDGYEVIYWRINKKGLIS